MSRVVLVTGVSRALGTRVANALLATPNVERVVGLDCDPPAHPLGDVEYVRATLQDGSVRRAVDDSGADTVVHLGFSAGPGVPVERRGRGSDPHLLGTMQLLAACQTSSSVRRFVVRSTASAGVGMAAGGPFNGDGAAGAERCVQHFARRCPDVSVAIVRFANLIGPTVDSPLTRYLALPAVPIVRGFDPRLQFIHEDDSVEVLRLMSLAGCAGLFHAAAPGAMRLSVALSRAGRSPLPMRDRELRMLGGLVRRGHKRGYSPQRLRQLCYDGVLDSTRLEHALGWRPRYTSSEAFDAFLGRYNGATASLVPLNTRRWAAGGSARP